MFSTRFYPGGFCDSRKKLAATARLDTLYELVQQAPTAPLLLEYSLLLAPFLEDWRTSLEGGGSGTVAATDGGDDFDFARDAASLLEAYKGRATQTAGATAREDWIQFRWSEHCWHNSPWAELISRTLQCAEAYALLWARESHDHSLGERPTRDAQRRQGYLVCRRLLGALEHAEYARAHYFADEQQSRAQWPAPFGDLGARLERYHCYVSARLFWLGGLQWLVQHERSMRQSPTARDTGPSQEEFDEARAALVAFAAAGQLFSHQSLAGDLRVGEAVLPNPVRVSRQESCEPLDERDAIDGFEADPARREGEDAPPRPELDYTRRSWLAHLLPYTLATAALLWRYRHMWGEALAAMRWQFRVGGRLDVVLYERVQQRAAEQACLVPLTIMPLVDADADLKYSPPPAQRGFSPLHPPPLHQHETTRLTFYPLLSCSSRFSPQS